MPLGPNAPQVGFVDGLTLFDIGIALAHKFCGTSWHPYSGENLPVLQLAQIRGV
jgi:hypothetical protein